MRRARAADIRRTSPRAIALCLLAVALGAGCGGAGAGGGDDGDDGGDGDGGPQRFVAEVTAAAEAVEAELGGPQQYFEITATAQLTNVFVAVDEATAAVPYVYRDGALEAPGPKLEGAAGNTFGREAIDVDEDQVLSRISDELPEVTIDSFSVEGGPDGSVRYVVAARSQEGGVLDVVVGPTGAILSVDPV